MSDQMSSGRPVHHAEAPQMPPRKFSIAENFDHVSNRLAQLEQAIEHLGNKLSPILLPGPAAMPEEMGSPDDVPQMSPIASGLYGMKRRTDAMLREMDAMINRLDVL